MNKVEERVSYLVDKAKNNFSFETIVDYLTVELIEAIVKLPKEDQDNFLANFTLRSIRENENETN